MFTTMRHDSARKCVLSQSALTTLLMLTAVFTSSCATAENYDSASWMKLTKPERIAFYSGVVDCYIYDVHGKDYSDKSFESNVQAIDAYYKNHPDAAKAQVLDVIREVARSSSKPKVPVERHSFFDGEYWRQSVDLEREAFVSGYLACRAKYLRVSTDPPVASIVLKVSKWYGVSDEDVSEIDPNRSPDKIGDLIDRFVGEKASP